LNKLKVFEGFAGIGAVSKAMERLNIPHELVGFSEIDKYAIKSFGLIHNIDESLNHGDVCTIDETKLPDFDLYTFGSPCQDFSVAGKQKGSTWTCEDCLDENDNPTEWNPLDIHWTQRDSCPKCNSKEINKTRSSLVVEALRIIRHKKPKYLLMENVKGLVGQQFKPSFDKIIAELQEYGYNTYWDVLNAKDYGIPQNRERVIVISIRKDIDNNSFKFPTGFDNGIRLRDLLEYEVDEKYYISQDKTEKLLKQLKDKNVSDGTMLDLSQSKREGIPRVYNDVSCTLTSRDYKEPRNIVEIRPCLTPDRIEKRQNGRRFKENDEPSFTLNTQDKHGILMIGMLDIKGNEQIRRVYDPEGLSPTLNTMAGGNRQPKIIESNELVQVGMLEGKGFETRRRVYSPEGLSPTLHGIGNGGNTEPKILETKKLGNVNPSGNGMNGNVYDSNGLCPTLTTNKGEGIKIGIDSSNSLQFVGGIDTTDKWIENDKDLSRNYKEGYRVYDSEGIACCQKSNGGGLGSNTGLYLETNKVMTYNTQDENGKEPPQQDRVYNVDGVMTTISAQLNGRFNILEKPTYRIRKLTPLECFRLMGFDDEDYYILKENGISNSQIYKMAGNSIVVNVLEEIFKVLFQNT